MWHTCKPYVLRGAFAFLKPERLWSTESVAGHGWCRARRLRRVVRDVYLLVPVRVADNPMPRIEQFADPQGSVSCLPVDPVFQD